MPGFNKAVQIGRTVINFSVKSVTSKGNQFGPKPQDGLIKNKMEENKFFVPKQEMENNNYDIYPEHQHLEHQIDQPFEMAIEQDNMGGNQDEARNDEIPSELPDNRRTKGGFQ